MNFRSDQNETIVTDPATGGQKGAKLARFDLIPQDVMWELAEHYGRGAKKYTDNNWLRGYRWSLSIASIFRHLASWLLGEERDEDGNKHIIAVVWHAIALATFALRRLGTDDRAASQGAPLTTISPVTRERKTGRG
jgi:hypothetical protein